MCRLRVLTSLRGLGVDLPEASRLARMCTDGATDTVQALARASSPRELRSPRHV